MHVTGYVSYLECYDQAIQERHENALLKAELEKLKEENKYLRENTNKTSCPNCGFATIGSRDTALTSDDHQQLKLENAKLKAEVSYSHSFFYINIKLIILGFERRLIDL